MKRNKEDFKYRVYLKSKFFANFLKIKLKMSILAKLVAQLLGCGVEAALEAAIPTPKKMTFNERAQELRRKWNILKIYTINWTRTMFENPGLASYFQTNTVEDSATELTDIFLKLDSVANFFKENTRLHLKTEAKRIEFIRPIIEEELKKLYLKDKK